MGPIFEVRDLSLQYELSSGPVQILKGLDFTIERGEFVGIQGSSGSGKSTLFYILGLLLRPSSGKVLFDGLDITRLTDDQLTLLRNQRIGFIFQQFHLLPRATVLDNILLPTLYPSETAVKDPKYAAKAQTLAESLGIGAQLERLPNQISGGQQQRVAIARALMNDVDLILADEPTGNLDSQNARQILALLTELNQQGKTIVLITHDPEVAKHCSKVYPMGDGIFTRTEENRKHRVWGSRACNPNQKSPTAPDPVLRAGAINVTSRGYLKVIQSTIPIAFENLFRNKVKSLLTMLGVVIGVAAVLAMITLGKFTRRKILETYEIMGVNKLLVSAYSNWRLRATDKVPSRFMWFDWTKDLLPLKEVFPEIRLISPEMQDTRLTATAGGLVTSDQVTVYGMTPEHLLIHNRTVEFGHAINRFHVQNRSPVCVVGREVVERLFARTNPLGKIINVSDGNRLNFPCEIIGVLATQTSAQPFHPPNLHVLVPFTYFQSVADNWWVASIHLFAIQVSPDADVEKTGKKIKAYFEQKYGKSINIQVDSDSTLVAQMKKFLSLFTVLLSSVAFLSLVVGGVGINNMMWVSLNERIKEFGIRKALGATNRTLRTQLLMESVVLCSVAGVIGLILGFAAYETLIFAATQFVAKMKFEWVVDGFAAALSFVSIVIVGLASGFAPAVRAEKLQVIEALRSE